MNQAHMMTNETSSAMPAQIGPEQLEIDLWGPPTSAKPVSLAEELVTFNQFGQTTQLSAISYSTPQGVRQVQTYTNQFWTSKQRAANALHEIPYRECFKPPLVHHIVTRLSEPGDWIYDPFMGRGTTFLEAALLGRIPWDCDINPLSKYLCLPRLGPPTVEGVIRRLEEIDFQNGADLREDLIVFYHPETLRELCELRQYLLGRQAKAGLDDLDRWIWMVALSRLTGHSPGFFSAYTLPPNQAVSIARQKKINEKYDQVPPRRHVSELIARKTKELLADCDDNTRRVLAKAADSARILTGDARHTPEIPSDSMTLVVTSPPFLDVVNYAADNWLRCWFAGIDAREVRLTVPAELSEWQRVMTDVMRELHRILRPGGHVAFEVGEVRKGRVRLEESALRCGTEAGLHPVLVLINEQEFTKTSNIWGIKNNTSGTNTNRIVVFQKR